MPKITFLPVNITCEANSGDTILDIAIQNDVPLQHACGGFCACTTCHVKVKSGLENLYSMEDDEKERLESTADHVEKNSRLGCQTKIKGDVVVEMVNQD
jgi:2Fe-2S ferredoxin